VPWDNNVEWHNVNIIENPEGGIASVQDVKEAEVQLVNVYNLPQDVDLIIERIVITFDEEIASSCATPDCQVAGTSVSNSAGHFLLCNSGPRPSLGGAQPAWRQ